VLLCCLAVCDGARARGQGNRPEARHRRVDEPPRPASSFESACKITHLKLYFALSRPLNFRWPTTDVAFATGSSHFVLLVHQHEVCHGSEFDHVTPVATRKLAVSLPPWAIATREVQRRPSPLGSLLVVYQRSLVLLGGAAPAATDRHFPVDRTRKVSPTADPGLQRTKCLPRAPFSRAPAAVPPPTR
jgi:hypothetical protein